MRRREAVVRQPRKAQRQAHGCEELCHAVGGLAAHGLRPEVESGGSGAKQQHAPPEAHPRMSTAAIASHMMMTSFQRAAMRSDSVARPDPQPAPLQARVGT